ncbi:bile salt-activated lipase-like isoform X2 [Lingula anatina]|nr:bile salt-activated lipase-like isoform X2 [Lingula anatina]|eukprot:XP_013397403.1 bile salt-activated lipase-like isoform X2 [Lingula anatina]
MSEDCLTLNIYVPGDVIDSGHSNVTKAVMVWIHGGAYRSGASSEYDFRNFATRGDVIVVSINYRLGALGFLSFEDATVPGNAGLWDQIQALMWIQDNIGNFGGNPNMVTIFGESAGGASASQLSLTTASRGLFQRVICQSGVATAQWSWVAGSYSIAQDLGRLLGCTTTSKMPLLACLKSVDAEKLISASRNVSLPKGVAYAFTPTIDGVMFTSPVTQMLQKPASDVMQHFLSLDFMAGFLNSDGGISLRLLPFDISEGISPGLLRGNFIPEFAKDLSSKFKDFITEKLLDVYFNASADNITTAMSLVDIFTDTAFGVPTVQLLASHASLPARTRGSSHLYYLTMQPSFPHVIRDTPDWFIGANHADELLYMLGEGATGRFNVTFTPPERLVSTAIITYWSNFAKTGNPNTPASLPVRWLPFTSINGSYVDIGNPVEARINLLPKRRSLWFQIMQLIATGGTTPHTPMTSPTTPHASAASSLTSCHTVVGLFVFFAVHTCSALFKSETAV